MTPIYVDATTLIGLGTIGELELLRSFDAMLIVLPAIASEVTTEPARTALDRLLAHEDVTTTPPRETDDERAMTILDESEPTGDSRLVGAILAHTDVGEPVAVISDDLRVRTVCRGFGADVTGTIGVIVRAVTGGLPAEDAHAIVRRLDAHGLHMTAELRTKADDLIDDAANS